MPAAPADQSANENNGSTRRDELRTFIFLTVVLAPVLAVVCVGGFGFLIWMSQLVLGPPGS